MSSSHAVTLGTFALLAVAVVCDLRTRTIPDSLPIALLALGALATALRWHDVTWTQAALGLAAGFAVGAALFYAGAMGGGDAKISAGLGAVCGWPWLLEVLFATALAGGLLSWFAKRRGMHSLPYAPAFAIGHAVTVAIAWTMPPAGGLWQLITERS